MIKQWDKTEDGARVPVWVQDPGAVLDYTLDWSNWLAAEDFIISADFYPDAGLYQVSKPSFTDTYATSWLYGGVVGKKYKVVCHILTNEGRQDERTFYLIIMEK